PPPSRAPGAPAGLLPLGGRTWQLRGKTPKNSQPPRLANRRSAGQDRTHLDEPGPHGWDDGSCLGICRRGRGSTREMQSSHAATAVDVAFDDPNLIADAGLVPVVALAEQVGLPG